MTSFSLTFFGHCVAKVVSFLLERSFWASNEVARNRGLWRRHGKLLEPEWILSPDSYCIVCCDLLFILLKTFHGTGKLWFAAVARTKTASGVIVCVWRQWHHKLLEKTPCMGMRRTWHGSDREGLRSGTGVFSRSVSPGLLPPREGWVGSHLQLTPNSCFFSPLVMYFP